jgi:hypothetical protein
LAIILHSLISGCIQNNRLPASFSTAYCKLIYKKGDPSNLENWRPISLINCDAKVFTKMIADRMQIVAPLLLKEDQVGFVKGRSIRSSIMAVRTVVSSYDAKWDDRTDEDRPTLVLLDQSKAYDRVQCLKFNFTLA